MAASESRVRIGIGVEASRKWCLQCEKVAGSTVLDSRGRQWRRPQWHAMPSTILGQPQDAAQEHRRQHAHTRSPSTRHPVQRHAVQRRRKHATHQPHHRAHAHAQAASTSATAAPAPTSRPASTPARRSHASRTSTLIMARWRSRTTHGSPPAIAPGAPPPAAGRHQRRARAVHAPVRVAPAAGRSEGPAAAAARARRSVRARERTKEVKRSGARGAAARAVSRKHADGGLDAHADGERVLGLRRGRGVRGAGAVGGEGQEGVVVVAVGPSAGGLWVGHWDWLVWRGLGRRHGGCWWRGGGFRRAERRVCAG